MPPTSNASTSAAGARSMISGPLVARRYTPSTAITFQVTIDASTWRAPRCARKTSGFRTPFCRLTTTASGRSTPASSRAASSVCWLFTHTSTTWHSASAPLAVATCSRAVGTSAVGPAKSCTTRPRLASWSRSRGRPTSTTSAASAARMRPPT